LQAINFRVMEDHALFWNLALNAVTVKARTQHTVTADLRELHQTRHFMNFHVPSDQIVLFRCLHITQLVLKHFILSCVRSEYRHGVNWSC
jgi:hypothetical protein